jgi:hypothetical protein
MIPDFLKVLFGAALSIGGGFLSDELKKRRRVKSAARVLLLELQRIYQNLETRPLSEPDVCSSLNAAATEYKQALFAVDRITFSEHWAILRELIDALDGDPAKRETLLVLGVRRSLAKLLGERDPGSAKELGVPEDGSPISHGPPRPGV